MRRAQDEAAAESARIARDVEEHQKTEAERAAARKAAHMQHADALLTQAELNRRLQQEEEERKEAEARRLHDLHEDYERQLESELQRLSVTSNGL